MNERALSTASFSTPAKTVTILVGRLLFSTAVRAAGRAFDAAQPQTELITTKTESLLLMAESTSSAVFKSSKPASVNSLRIGATKYSGYIFIFFKCVGILILNKDTNTQS